MCKGICVIAVGCLSLTSLLAAAPSVARIWNEENLAAIRIDIPHPPVHARNLFHVAVAMYDAWAAYDEVAVGCIHHERAAAPDRAAARNEAVSYAAYRVLKSRFASSVSASATTAALDAAMASLGYDKSITTTVGTEPAALGNRIAASILAWGLTDGSGQLLGYQDPAYSNPQPPLVVLDNGVIVAGIPAATDPDRWQPLALDQAITQNGIPIPQKIQPYVGVTWLSTRPFCLGRPVASEPWIDPGPPARLRGGEREEYVTQALDVLTKSSQLSDPAMIDISPGAIGNHSLGQEDGAGRPENPFTGNAYAPNLVPRGDYGRVLAEFWADGPESETPPGHWHTIANHVTDALAEKRIAGTGGIVDDLEWDVKLYFAVAAATHEAACAAWGLKRYYESPRPITMIRFMGSKGQSSDPGLPSYDEEGLPLIPDLVELATSDSLAGGGRHQGSGASPGGIVVRSWPGGPQDPVNQTNPVRWIRAVAWIPYQKKTFVSPAFPGYISGHSTFSRAAAVILAEITGSEYFPGGLGTFDAPAETFLKFEKGPSVDVQLQWATYFDASDEAGVSRRWGGIHPQEDDLPGRIIGAECGHLVWQEVVKYWDGSIQSKPMGASIVRAGPSRADLTWQSVRGLFYTVESSSGPGPWTTAVDRLQATDLTTTWTDVSAAGGRKFYRVRQVASH